MKRKNQLCDHLSFLLSGFKNVICRFFFIRFFFQHTVCCAVHSAHSNFLNKKGEKGKNICRIEVRKFSQRGAENLFDWWSLNQMYIYCIHDVKMQSSLAQE